MLQLQVISNILVIVTETHKIEGQEITLSVKR